MITDSERVRLYNKKILPYDQFKDMFLDNLLTAAETLHTDVYNLDGVFSAAVALAAGGSNNTMSIAAAFRGVTGQGRTVDIGALDSRFQDVPVPPSAATVFHVGVEQYEVEDGIETNPRTTEYEYRNFVELVGRKGVPTSVTDNGNGTITFNINSITESGYSYAGRQVRVWLKSRTDGGLGPLAATEGEAIETCTVAYGAPNNTITTVGNFGQDTVSTTAAQYVVMIIGPTIIRTAAEDLRTTAGCLYLGALVSVAGGNPLVTFDTSEQRVFEFSLADMADNFHTAVNEMTRSGVISGLNNTGTAGLNFTLASGVYWMGGRRIEHAGQVVAITDTTTGYVYLDTDEVIKYSTNLGTAASLPRLLLYRVTAAGGAITVIEDIRRFWTRVQSSKTFVTVGHINCDFTDLHAAYTWMSLVGSQGEDQPFELVVHGDLAMTDTLTIDRSGVVIRGVSRGHGHIATPSGSFAFDTSGTPDHVVFRDLTFEVPTDVGSGVLDMTSSVASEWEWRYCEFNGGEDQTLIGLPIGEVAAGSCVNWLFDHCYFHGATHSADTPYILLGEGHHGWRFTNSRFEGSTANDNMDCLWFSDGSNAHLISGCRFNTGGKAIIITDTDAASNPGAGSLSTHNVVSGCFFTGHRDETIVANTLGRTVIRDNHFKDCASVGAFGVVKNDTAGTMVVTGNYFEDWDNGAAIQCNAGDDHVFDNNRIITNAAAVVAAIEVTHTGVRLHICGNYIDIDRANTSIGSGKANGTCILANDISYSIICNNKVLNSGATGSESPGITFDTWCVVMNNYSFYGAGEFLKPTSNGASASNLMQNNPADSAATTTNKVRGNELLAGSPDVVQMWSSNTDANATGAPYNGVELALQLIIGNDATLANRYVQLSVVDEDSDGKPLWLQARNYGFGHNGQYGSGAGVLGIKNAATNPTTNPTGGGVLYADAGAGKWRGSGGTVTTFGPAEPHCPTCGRDCALEWEHEPSDVDQRSWKLAVCVWCLTEAIGDKGVFVKN